MKKIKVIIGANFGDEGKGLATDYFSDSNTLVVLHNGGSQRGHTVTSPDGLKHVFSHFGSGTFRGAHTFFNGNYVVSPEAFLKELKILKSKGINPIALSSFGCLVSSVYDVLLNQILESNRGENRHGSCGMGIYETIKRNEESSFILPLTYMMGNDYIEKLSSSSLQRLMTKVRENNIDPMSIDKDIMNLIFDISKVDKICKEDLKMFFKKIGNLCNFNDIIFRYDNFIFEGGQGLLLDKMNDEYFPNLTYSNTGSVNPIEILRTSNLLSTKKVEIEIEVVYVTRTYLTRHGAGLLKTECRKEEINKTMNDNTNQPNEFQGFLRYGHLDIKELKERIDLDFNKWKKNGIKATKSLMITHINEYSENVYDIINNFKEDSKIYLSDGETRNNVFEKV